MSEAYERLLVPAVFAPFAQELAARAARVARPPTPRILELAAGTGVLTRHLLTALPSATVAATDLNAAMVEAGRRHAPGASWQQADAARLPFDPGSFDLVRCQFGVMFLPDRRAAYAEAARVLAPGGRLLFATWGPLETHGFAGALDAGLARAFPDDPPRFIRTVPHGYGDRDAVVADVQAAGLAVVAADWVAREGRGTVVDVARGFCLGTPVRAEIDERGDLEAPVAIVTEEMTRRLGSGAVATTMEALVVEPVRPA